MLKDNNLVRNLATCENMVNVTTICSDKIVTPVLNKIVADRGMLLYKNFQLLLDLFQVLLKCLIFIWNEENNRRLQSHSISIRQLKKVKTMAINLL